MRRVEVSIADEGGGEGRTSPIAASKREGEARVGPRSL